MSSSDSSLPDRNGMMWLMLRSRRRRRFQFGRTTGVLAAFLAVNVAIVGSAVAYNVIRLQPRPDSTIVPPPVVGTVAPEAEPIDMSRVSSVLFIGDSWTYGVGASIPTNGFAYKAGERLGVPFEVHGFRTVGYVNRGLDGAGNFEQRWADVRIERVPDLIVLQGSSNDQDGEGYRDVHKAASSFIGVLRKQFPAAQLALMGPAYPRFESKFGIDRVNGALNNAAVSTSTVYISPVRENWFTASNIAQFMNPLDGVPHPSDAGAVYLADRLLTDLRAGVTGGK